MNLCPRLRVIKKNSTSASAGRTKHLDKGRTATFDGSASKVTKQAIIMITHPKGTCNTIIVMPVPLKSVAVMHLMVRLTAPKICWKDEEDLV